MTLAEPQRGRPVLLPAESVYEPGGSAKWNAPVVSELPITNGVFVPARYTATVVAYGLSAHCGSDWMRITWQVGPSETTPRTPESVGTSAAVDVAEVVLATVADGHGANSQLGPERPTAEPSGQIFASIVHATPPLRGGAFAKRASVAHNAPPTTTTIPRMIKKYSFIR